ncbi:hypothetical protein DPMN_157135 [Dreissena polymorpha]|uniref:Uncharacterized protein n=1 Tax=Dreissena polymorpha TaxID=45954 RepID=A0A9D4INK8_DREPO|nr:hypothetical protein DPMN_157135 [Dreissena polymorpha]
MRACSTSVRTVSACRSSSTTATLPSSTSTNWRWPACLRGGSILNLKRCSKQEWTKCHGTTH